MPSSWEIKAKAYADDGPDADTKYVTIGSYPNKAAAERALQAMRQAAREEYNGWTNRETWAANLWLNNTETLYNAARRLALECQQEGQEWADRMTAEHGDREAWNGDAAAWHAFEDRMDLEEYAGMLRDPRDGTPASMLQDIGSAWRIDWEQIYHGFIEE